MSRPRKLTDDDIREIREIYRMAERVRKQEGKPIRKGLRTDLAKKYGVDRRTITYIRSEERRKSVKLQKRAKG